MLLLFAAGESINTAVAMANGWCSPFGHGQQPSTNREKREGEAVRERIEWFVGPEKISLFPPPPTGPNALAVLEGPAEAECPKIGRTLPAGSHVAL